MPIKRPGPVLTDLAIEIIHKAVHNVFQKAKNRILGMHSVDKKIVFGHIPHNLSLQGLFENSCREEGAVPDLKTFKQLADIAASYIDATEARTKAQVVHEVSAFLKNAHHTGVKTDLTTVLGGKLTEVLSNTTASMRRIIDTEAQNVKNFGVLEGITRINAAQGNDDPTIFWVSVNDDTRCDECTKLHCLDDDITPRVYKLSEASSGYHKKGETSPKIAGLHPHCRCTLTGLSPGYGFIGGKIAYIGQGHDEYLAQRSK